MHDSACCPVIGHLAHKLPSGAGHGQSPGRRSVDGFRIFLDSIQHGDRYRFIQGAAGFDRLLYGHRCRVVRKYYRGGGLDAEEIGAGSVAQAIANPQAAEMIELAKRRPAWQWCGFLRRKGPFARLNRRKWSGWLLKSVPERVSKRLDGVHFAAGLVLAPGSCTVVIY